MKFQVETYVPSVFSFYIGGILEEAFVILKISKSKIRLISISLQNK